MRTIKINIFKKKGMFLFVGIFIAIFICMNLVSATLVPAPSIYAWEGGRVIVVDKDLNTFIPTGDFVAEGGYIDKNGTKVFWRTITPDEVILKEEGESPAPDSYDYDVQVYIPKVADPKDVGFSAPNKPFDPNIGWWITSTAREMGPAISNLGLNFITLGWYNVYQQYEYYSDSRNLPATWGETGLEMLDNVPVAGSIKAAVESEGWESAGHISSAVSQGILIGVGGYKALSRRAAETTAIVKYDPEFAMEQAVSGKGIILFAEETPHFGITNWEVMTPLRIRDILGKSNWKSHKLNLIDVIKEANIKQMSFMETLGKPLGVRGSWSLLDPKKIKLKMIGFSDKEIVGALLHEGIHMRDFFSGEPYNMALYEYRAYRVWGLYCKKAKLPLDWKKECALKGRDPFMQNVATKQGWWPLPPGELDRRAWK